MVWKPQSVTISLNLHTEHWVEEERPDKGFNLELELPLLQAESLAGSLKPFTEFSQEQRWLQLEQEKHSLEPDPGILQHELRVCRGALAGVCKDSFSYYQSWGCSPKVPLCTRGDHATSERHSRAILNVLYQQVSLIVQADHELSICPRLALKL